MFDGNDKKLFDWCIKNREAFAGDKPVPTNWDYSPNNWMIDKYGKFIGIIDFENMLWGIPYDSFGVIIERYTLENLKLLDFFLKGYGYIDTTENRIKLNICKAKMAFADIVYGRATNWPRASHYGKKYWKN